MEREERQELEEAQVGERTARAMFVRPFREPAAAIGIVLACLIPAASSAASHRAGPAGLQRGPGFTFSIGHGTTPATASFRFRDFSHAHETLKPLEMPATPKPVESAFPSFSNPLHRHRMALITF